MRGRRPSGPEYVARLQGSVEAKRRVRIILETLSGERRVQDACRELNISEQRFHQLREEMLQAAVAGIEPLPAGRPPRPEPAGEAVELQQRVQDLEIELKAAQTREEIALVLPKVVQAPAEPEKKTPPQRQQRNHT